MTQQSAMPDNNQIILYGHPFCSMVPPTITLLKWVQVNFVYIDVTKNEVVLQQLITLNNGYASVPTIVFPDGSKLTEPCQGELKAKLKTLGYEIPTPRWLQIFSKWFG